MFYNNETLQHSVAFNAGFSCCYSLLAPEIERLVEALKFYADENNWSECTDQTTSHMIGPDDHSAIVPFGKKFKAGLNAYKAISDWQKFLEGEG